MDNFDKLASLSDIKGIKALKDFMGELGFTDYTITPSIDRYSVWDLRLDLNDKVILVEVKLRNRKFNTLMMEAKKAKSLTSNLLTEDNKKVYDHWYLNVFKSGEEPVIFSLNKLRGVEKVIKKGKSTITDTIFTGNYIALCNIKANKTTAMDNGKIYKACWFIPTTLKIN